LAAYNTHKLHNSKSTSSIRLWKCSTTIITD